MEILTAEAVVLDVTDLQEYDRIVTFLTRERGKKRGVAKGARRKHSRFGGELQPLAKVRVNWVEHAGRELVRVSSMDILRSAADLQADLDGILLGSYLADHMLEFAQEDEPEDHLFRLLDSTLEALDAGVDRDLATRYFEAWVLRLAGIFPPPWACPTCEREYDLEDVVLPNGGEGLVCGKCGRGHGSVEIGRGTLEFLRIIGSLGLPELAGLEPPTAATLDQVEAVCARIRREFLQHELKSYGVIRETKSAYRA